jgi:hypothetical protein
MAAMTQRNWKHEEIGPKRYHREAEFPPRLKLLRWVGRQTWLPKGQERVVRAILNPDLCDHFLFEVDFFGLKYRGDLAHFVDWLVFCYGAAPLSELSILEEMTRQIRVKRPGPINSIDVGANAGHHTLFMARIVDQVLAVEPFPALQDLISEKIAINSLTNVRVAPFALGEKNEIRNYYAGEGAIHALARFYLTRKKARFGQLS